MFEFKQAGGWFSIFASSVEAESSPFSPDDSGETARGANPQGSAPAGPNARVSHALGALRQYYRWTRMLPAGAALNRILEHSGYLALAATAIG